MSVSFAPALLLLFITFQTAQSGYLITTPRRWTTKSKSQICFVVAEEPISKSDQINYTLTELLHGAVLVNDSTINLLQGKRQGCLDIPVPETQDRKVNLRLSGSLNKEEVSENVNLTFVEKTRKTFVQTDKPLYKPGHEVQFRILSLEGQNLDLVTQNYEEVYITNPSRTRIAQWNDVDNSAGLVHLSFSLYDEVEEGTYTIGVKFRNGNEKKKHFKVEDYVLPRYEITIEPTKLIFGDDETVTLKVCAKYTFGEPVSGNATLYLSPSSWRVYTNLTEHKKLSGCENFTFSAKELLFDQNNCHIRVSALSAVAKVREDGTGVELFGSNSRIPIHRRAIKFVDLSPTSIKKPYLPRTIKVAAIRPDKSPAENETIEVCVISVERERERVCRNLTTSSPKGLLTLIIPSYGIQKIQVTAINHPRVYRNWNDVMKASEFAKYFYHETQFVDPSNFSLSIFTGEEVECLNGKGVTFDLPIIYVANDQHPGDIYVQISARGQVIHFNKTRVTFMPSDLPFKGSEQLVPLEDVPQGMARGLIKVPISLGTKASPEIQVLVWFTTAEGIVVADSTEIEISDCFPQDVTLEWSTEKEEPGGKAQLTVSGASNSLCSIGVVDKSVALLSSGKRDLNIRSILRIAQNSDVLLYDEGQLDLQYCQSKFNSTKGNATSVSGISFERHSMRESLHMFNKAGYYVVSNLVLENLFCEDLIIRDLKQQAELSRVTTTFSSSLGSFLTTQMPQPIPALGEALLHSTNVKEGATVAELEDFGAHSENERSYLPETWLWLLRPLQDDEGKSEEMTLPDKITEWVGKAVCVHPTKGVGMSEQSSITTFTPFFVSLTLPSTAKRGETLPVVISVFNYINGDLPVELTLEQNENFKFVMGENGTRKICLESKKKSVETFKVQLTEIGKFNITVEAVTRPNANASCGSGAVPAKKDRLKRSFLVEPEGYSRERTQSSYICSQDVANKDEVFDQWTLYTPKAIVEGSEQAWVTATGDLLGPTLENIGHLVRLPSGCGEQNMVKFAPNIFVLHYLEASKQTTPSIKSKITKYLSQGYQRQLLFGHKNHSYSAFGEKDSEGSTWLTAFVVKSFAQARNYTLIDYDSLLKSVEWLKGLQKENGCFESRGIVINKMLQGGLKDSGRSEKLLTTYVLLSLVEEGSVSEPIIQNATECISKDVSQHPYSLALRSYTLALVNKTKAKLLVEKLNSMAITNSSIMRWELPDREGVNTALHVETAAYALMAFIALDPELYSEESRKVVRWLSNQRNGQGGFISTQDTVVALQALAAFERAQPKEERNLKVSLSSGDLNHTFAITDVNKILEQRVYIPKLPSNLALKLEGHGCSLLQSVVRYNVLAESESTAFTLTVESKQVPEKGCSTHNITACTSYTLSDESSNMAILEVKLPSGYVPLKNDLKEIVGNGNGTFKRYEVDGPKVTFYMDEVTLEEVCAGFRIYQEIPIENAKPGSVTVYDYYQPEYIVSQKFEVSHQECNSVR